jgi:transcriptional regulator with GAF, ATPase, and Fis domain
MGTYMSEVSTKTDGNGNIEQNQASDMGRAPSTGVLYSPSFPELSLRSFRDEAEIHAISSALKHTGWNRKRAAQLLSISYRGLLYKIRRHNLAPFCNLRIAIMVWIEGRRKSK